MARFDTHDAYLASLPDDQRAALETLRAQIRAAAPEADEMFSYGIPAFRVGPGKGPGKRPGKGKVLVGYAAMKQHCGFYVFEGDLVGRFADRLAAFSIAQGAVRFTPDHPIPAALVAQMVAARRAKIG
ncbi:MAG TPA: hypothetical protein DIU07_15985 [Rhodobacteraceae bacterium]|nr:hypothetical protein [Paracoccaceae bacterium]